MAEPGRPPAADRSDAAERRQLIETMPLHDATRARQTVADRLKALGDVEPDPDAASRDRGPMAEDVQS